MLHTIDLISEAKFLIQESISNMLKAEVIEPKVQNTIGIGFLSKDMLGKLNLDLQEPILVPA